MSVIKQKGDKARYSVLDKDCIGCECLQLGTYQHRGATLSGSRNTGATSPCCMRRAYHGCPDNGKRGFSELLASQRRKEGMKIS